MRQRGRQPTHRFSSPDFDRKYEAELVRHHVEQHCPDAVTEVDPDFLDPLIDDRAKQWVIGAESAYETYSAQATEHAGNLRARLALLEDQCKHLEEKVPEREQTPFVARPRRGRLPAVAAYVVALALVVGADLTAFNQVVSLLLPTQSETWILMLVLGFTAAALLLAAGTGKSWRSKTEGGWGSPSAAFLCGVGWLALGATATWARLSPDAVLPSTVPTIDGSSPTTSADDSALAAALLFVCLYVASGIITFVGALKHSRLAGTARWTVRDRTRNLAEKRWERRIRRYKRVEALLNAQEEAIRSAKKILDLACDERRAYADELRSTARLWISARINDPLGPDNGHYQQPFPPDQTKDPSRTTKYAIRGRTTPKETHA